MKSVPKGVNPSNKHCDTPYGILATSASLRAKAGGRLPIEEHCHRVPRTPRVREVFELCRMQRSDRNSAHQLGVARAATLPFDASQGDTSHRQCDARCGSRADGYTPDAGRRHAAQHAQAGDQTHGSNRVTRSRPPADYASQVTHTPDRASSRSGGSGGAGMRPLPRCGLTRKAREKAQA